LTVLERTEEFKRKEYLLPAPSRRLAGRGRNASALTAVGSVSRSAAAVPAGAADGEAVAACKRHNELMTLIRRLNDNAISLLTARIDALQQELLLRLAAPPAAAFPPAPPAAEVAGVDKGEGDAPPPLSHEDENLQG
jgi:hypothetical protein